MIIISGLCICQAPGIWHVVGAGSRGATTEPEKAHMNFKRSCGNDSEYGHISGILLIERVNNEKEETSV